MRSDAVNYKGRKIGTLKVIDVGHVKDRHRFWLTQCDCGALTYLSSQQLRRGQRTHKDCPLIKRKVPSGREELRAYQRIKEKERRDRNRAEGLCIRCRDIVAPGRTRCEYHLLVAREDEANRARR